MTDETTEVRRKRTSGQSESELAFFIDGLGLSPDDKGGELAEKGVGVGRGDEDGSVWGMMGHGSRLRAGRGSLLSYKWI